MDVRFIAEPILRQKQNWLKLLNRKDKVTIMTIFEIRIIAKNLGIAPEKKNKADLIKSIQVKEGNIPCFKTAANYCDQTDCCWRKDCLK